MESDTVGRVEKLLDAFHVKHGRLPRTPEEILAVKREAEALEPRARVILRPKQA